jgi:anti-sigma B factor antagonist
MSIDPAEVSASMLQLQISIADGATVVVCRGKLMAENADVLKREVKGRIPDKRRIVLDLSELTRMDSSGLGAIVSIYVSAKAGGCELQLVNLNKQIRELMRLTNLLSVFEACGPLGIRMP